MQIGTQDERYLIIQIDLLDENGATEAINMLNLLIESKLIVNGEEHLQHCMDFVKMIYRMKHIPN